MSKEYLIQKLKNKRKEIADREGKEIYMVFSNDTIENTIDKMPKSKEELLQIKGWGNTKVERYGDEIINLIYNKEKSGNIEVQTPLLGEAVSVSEEKEKHVFSVGKFIEFLNIGLKKSKARIKGEVSSVDNRGRYIFFGLKDKEDESLLTCLMWESNYNLSGVRLEEGLEVIVHGYPNIYKRNGRLSFMADTVELVGEGALKKAYEELKDKLKKEGIFAEEKKKKIPAFPHKIGVITSKTGAVIHDFLNNLDRFGFKIFFKDSRVEGQRAVSDLLSSIRFFKDKDIDVLVIMRGGGSLESLLPFNNEIIVKEISEFSKPVICGIGHDKDVPLASMASDLAVSTPTAVTKILNKTWEEAKSRVVLYEKTILHSCNRSFTSARYNVFSYVNKIKEGVEKVFDSFDKTEKRINIFASNFGYLIEDTKEKLRQAGRRVISGFRSELKKQDKALSVFERTTDTYNPERQLKLGYSLLYLGGKIIRKTDQVKKGDMLDIKVSDGTIESEVKNKEQKNNG